MSDNPPLQEILKKLRSNAPDWFDRYVEQYERDYNFHLSKLLTAKPEETLRQQGIVACMNAHLALLKLCK